MSMIFDILPEIISEILSYLDLKNLVNTDSAILSKKNRPIFLECLKNTTFHFLDFLILNQAAVTWEEMSSELIWFDLKEMFTKPNSLPSLKSIKIEYDTERDDEEDDEEFINITLKYINASSNMETLYIYSSTFMWLNNSIFLAAKSLKSLTLDYINFEQLTKCTEILGEMKCLKKLVINMYDPDDNGVFYRNDIMTFTETSFENLTEFEFKMCNLSDACYNINPFKTISESSFSKNLERLSLNVYTDGDLDFKYLNFPNLKYLTIVNSMSEDDEDDEFDGDDFIDNLTTYCTKLEEIDIVCYTGKSLHFLANRCLSLSKITIRNIYEYPNHITSIKNAIDMIRITHPQISVLNIVHNRRF
jgi:hypothetical protein